MEDQIIHLETKIAYLENFVNELNTVIISQQSQIDQLNKELNKIQDQMTSGSEGDIINEPPPHY